MTPALSWTVIVVLSIAAVVAVFRFDSWAWRIREERAERKLRRELEALRRIHQGRQS